LQGFGSSFPFSGRPLLNLFHFLRKSGSTPATSSTGEGSSWPGRGDLGTKVPVTNAGVTPDTVVANRCIGLIDTDPKRF